MDKTEELRQTVEKKGWILVGNFLNKSTKLEIRCKICKSDRHLDWYEIKNKLNSCKKCQVHIPWHEQKRFETIKKLVEDPCSRINLKIRKRNSKLISVNGKIFTLLCRRGHKFFKHYKRFSRSPWCEICFQERLEKGEKNRLAKKTIEKHRVEIALQQKRWKIQNLTSLRPHESVFVQCQLCGHSWYVIAKRIIREKNYCPNCAGISLEQTKDITGIIYRATAPDGQVYIGQTIRTLKSRIWKHVTSMNNKTKINYYHSKFMTALRIQGPENFKWEILHYAVPWNKISEYEMKEIENHNSFAEGLNSTPGGSSIYKNARCVKLRTEKERILKELRKQQRDCKKFKDNVSRELKKFFYDKKNQPETDSKKIERKLLNSLKRSIEAKNFDRSEKSSLFRGVCWNKLNKKWQSNIRANNKKLYLGLFVDENAAARAYDAAAKKYFGSKAKLNFK